ncbi:MAG: 8-oxo-dGTP pyrophosphatase MutT and related house-cleaning NTP pyrophosphohydrolases [Methanophagales archaeon]|nr:8-oxo-dGTP pyrophosphatase MutT and related house-cleaning NTP pyrophosphohydrolases [Methanophagales archaeon]
MRGRRGVSEERVKEAAEESKASVAEEKTVRSETIYEGRLLKIRLEDVALPDGRRKKREIVVHPGASAVLALRRKQSGEEILFVEQFRKAVQRSTLEIPAGTLEAGETPESCARRELLEETGYSAERFEKLLSFFPSPGYSTEVIHIFKAEGLRKVEERSELKVRFLTLEDAISRIKRGEIMDGKTIIALMLLQIETASGK